MQESASFRTEIESLEDQLAETPDSFCFARLSEAYLKMGQIDDALRVARLGVTKHPRYLSGQKALSLACHAKGLDDEALAALELITDAVPEDVTSQKLLGRLYAAAGNQDAACRSFRTALEFAPDDPECGIELEALARPSVMTEAAFGPDGYEEEEEEIIEDLEIYEEIDILEDYEGESESEFLSQETPPESDVATASHNDDPLSTVTLAELYVRQGYINKALDIYRALLADNPADLAMAARVDELEALETGGSKPESEDDSAFDEDAVDDPDFSMLFETAAHEAGTTANLDAVALPDGEDRQADAAFTDSESTVSSQPQAGSGNALATLDGWLENVGKIKSCH